VTNRILDFGEMAAHLKLDNGRLCAEFADETRDYFAFSDLAVVVTSHRQVTLSQSLIAALGRANVALVCSDEKHLPVSMLLPVESHSTQAERFSLQVAASEPSRKRVWQRIIRAKVEMQGRILKQLHGDDSGLCGLAAQVRSGDPSNVESTAAQRYWPRLFQDTEYRRGNDEDARNHLLNYGYGILRATTARAICGAGLHPTFGVHHRNRYNAFALADDMMEPFRPLVDLRVVEYLKSIHPFAPELNKTAKLAILSALIRRYLVEGESRTLFDIQARNASSLAACLCGGAAEFHFARPDVQDAVE